MGLSYADRNVGGRRHPWASNMGGGHFGQYQASKFGDT